MCAVCCSGSLLVRVEVVPQWIQQLLLDAYELNQDRWKERRTFFDRLKASAKWSTTRGGVMDRMETALNPSTLRQN